MFYTSKQPYIVSMLATNQTIVLHASLWAIVRFLLPSLGWLTTSCVSAYLIYAEFSRHNFVDETWKYWLGLVVFLWFAGFGCSALLKIIELLRAWPFFYIRLQLSPQGLHLKGLEHKIHIIKWTDIQSIKTINLPEKSTTNYMQLTVTPEHFHRLQSAAHINKPYFIQQAQKLLILLPTWQWRSQDVSLAIMTYWGMHSEGFSHIATDTSLQSVLPKISQE